MLKKFAVSWESIENKLFSLFKILSREVFIVESWLSYVSNKNPFSFVKFFDVEYVIPSTSEVLALSIAIEKFLYFAAFKLLE